MPLTITVIVYLIGTLPKILLALSIVCIFALLLIGNKKKLPATTDTLSEAKGSKGLPLDSTTTTTNLTPLHLPGPLDTLYEVKESPTSPLFDECLDKGKGSSSMDGIKKTTTPSTVMRPSQTLAKAPIPQPSFSSPPLTNSYYGRRRSHSQSSTTPSSYSHHGGTPPLTMSPSLSTSTTDSQQGQSPALSPSCSTASSLRQRRRNSRVGQLVQHFEMNRLDTRPLIKAEHIRSPCKVSDTIASLNRHQDSSSTTTTTANSPHQCTDSPRSIIDHRSVGFHPVFTAWEKRATEAHLLPMPSQSTPTRLSTNRTSPWS
ncbi:hypothetical protein [Absidia glauca]|uniref:Uncharacterized protein n=1 Tax=Absidia glauca TaxID=4829 RepID=A0A168NXT6_ABSGL|nr:hypothetical protein [Absidia glauca]